MNRKRTTSQKNKKPTKPDTESLSGERLQKVLARSGLGSRRAIEKQISAGEIMINGKTASLGDRVDEDDRLTVSNMNYQVISEDDDACRVILFNKPEGVICTRSDPEGRPTAFDNLPRLHRGRWVMIGRLDINTTGLLLFTNDGELANSMMHPSNGVDREYACRVLGDVPDETLERLKKGIELDDGMARFSDIVAAESSGENRWFHVTIMEGRNREVRRLWEAAGFRVSRLKRVRYGPVFLTSKHRVGRWEEMSARNVRVLREDVGLKSRTSASLKVKRLHSKR